MISKVNIKDVEDILVRKDAKKFVEAIKIENKQLTLYAGGYEYVCELDKANIHNLICLLEETKLDLLEECIEEILLEYIFSF